MRRIPDSARANLIGRLRDRNDINHKAAKYELLLYSFWKHRGKRVSLNEPVGAGDADLLVSNGTDFLIEVATVFPDPEEERRYKHLNEICGTIDDLRDDQFIAEVDANYGWPPVDLRPGAAKRAVRSHLELMKRGETSIDSEVRLGKVMVRLLPGHLPNGFVGAINYPVEWRGTPEQARSAVAKKVQKFKTVKESGRPLVVALCDGGLHQDFNRAIDRVLFGAPGVISERENTRATTRSARSPEGFFGPRGTSTRLSAVLGCSYRLTTRCIELRMKVWHNPRASNPIPKGVFDPLPQLAVFRQSSGNEELRWTKKTVGLVRLRL
jgi:hypothetical protein